MPYTLNEVDLPKQLYAKPTTQLQKDFNYCFQDYKLHMVVQRSISLDRKPNNANKVKNMFKYDAVGYLSDKLMKTINKVLSFLFEHETR